MKTICIMCPMGCPLSIEKNNGSVIVSGNSCPRGKAYGEREFTAPERIVTSLVRLNGGGVVSVKTSSAVPKDRVFDVLDELKKVMLTPPVKIGDTAIKNVLGLGADIVVTANRG